MVVMTENKNDNKNKWTPEVMELIEDSIKTGEWVFLTVGKLNRLNHSYTVDEVVEKRAEIVRQMKRQENKLKKTEDEETTSQLYTRIQLINMFFPGVNITKIDNTSNFLGLRVAYALNKYKCKPIAQRTSDREQQFLLSEKMLAKISKYLNKKFDPENDVTIQKYKEKVLGIPSAQKPSQLSLDLGVRRMSRTDIMKHIYGDKIEGYTTKYNRVTWVLNSLKIKPCTRLKKNNTGKIQSLVFYNISEEELAKITEMVLRNESAYNELHSTKSVENTISTEVETPTSETPSEKPIEYVTDTDPVDEGPMVEEPLKSESNSVVEPFEPVESIENLQSLVMEKPVNKCIPSWLVALLTVFTVVNSALVAYLVYTMSIN